MGSTGCVRTTPASGAEWPSWSLESSRTARSARARAGTVCAVATRPAAILPGALTHGVLGPQARALACTRAARLRCRGVAAGPGRLVAGQAGAATCVGGGRRKTCRRCVRGAASQTRPTVRATATAGPAGPASPYRCVLSDPRALVPRRWKHGRWADADEHAARADAAWWRRAPRGVGRPSPARCRHAPWW